MTTYFVTRHRGAIEWAASQGLAVDQLIEHLDTSVIQPGDTVIGSLPVNLAADVCARGGRYYHLTLVVPRELRGVELSAEAMQQAGASVDCYYVRREV
jgi:CRISPR-associated protein Csx16